MEQPKYRIDLIILTILAIIVIIGLIIYMIIISLEKPAEPITTPDQVTESPTKTPNDLILKTFITTVYIGGEPEDINLASFAQDQEPLLAAAQIDPLETNILFQAKWYYLEAGPELNFYDEEPQKSPSSQFIISSLRFNQLDEKIQKYQTLPNTFPTGKYRIDWLADNQKITHTEFFVSGQ